jgi:type I restriction enzyme S subunit
MHSRKIVPLGEIAEEITVGYVGPMANEYVEDGVPFLRSLNIRPFRFDPTDLKFITPEFHQKIRKSALKHGDVAVVRTGNPGVSCVIPEELSDANCSDLVVIRPGAKLDPEFVSYYINSITKSHIKGQLVGAIQQHFNIGAAKEIHFPNISKQEQKKLSSTLTALDAKIALNHRINSELEGMAKLLYDYWFVQYDFPLSAAQAAALGKPHLAGKPYRSSGGPMVYHEQLKREIPKGWKVGNLSELCHLNHRTRPNKDHPDQVIYLDLANAKNGEILSVQNFAWDEAPSRARRILTPGDTIFGTVRPGNRSFALVPKSKEILTGSTGFAVLTPKSAIYREFNYLSLTSESNINRLTTVASGAAYPAVNPEVVAAQTIAIPDTDLIQQFHQTTAYFVDLIERHRAQNQELTTLRDWLLPMLMNGQVRVTG